MRKCSNSGHEKCNTLGRCSLGKRGIIFPFDENFIGSENGTMGGMHGHMGVAPAGAFDTEYLQDNRFELEDGGQVSEGGGDSQI